MCFCMCVCMCVCVCRHPLTRHAVAKALSCPPTAFIDKPAYLRMLLEVSLTHTHTHTHTHTPLHAYY